MNNKEFITELAKRLNYTSKDTSKLLDALITEMGAHLEDEDSINIQGFGNFEVKKKMERIVVNPGTKQRMLVPPKIVVSFKPSSILKDKIQ